MDYRVITLTALVILGTMLIAASMLSKLHPRYMTAAIMLMLLFTLAALIFEMPVAAMTLAVALVMIYVSGTSAIVSKQMALRKTNTEKQETPQPSDTKPAVQDPSTTTSSTESVQVGSLETSKRNDELDDEFFIRGYVKPSSFSPAEFGMI